MENKERKVIVIGKGHLDMNSLEKLRSMAVVGVLPKDSKIEIISLSSKEVINDEVGPTMVNLIQNEIHKTSIAIKSIQEDFNRIKFIDDKPSHLKLKTNRGFNKYNRKKKRR